MKCNVLHIFWHADCLKHDPGKGIFESPPSPLIAILEPHPETATRILNIKSALENGPLAKHLEWHVGRHATEAELATFHKPDYIQFVQQAVKRGPVSLDESGTVVDAGSWEAATAAAGCTLEAVDFILEGQGKLAYALVRPPGHHAQPDMADGSCIFNNVALAVERACQRGVERIAVIDWDVHHGNGTQEGFYKRADVLTISIHMDHDSWGPYHPQTGKADEIGLEAGRGYNRNIPLPYGVGDQVYEQVMQELVTPLIDDFKPNLLLVAAGQDANHIDPNGRQLVTMNGFRQLGRHARTLADRHADGRLLLVQEGGYAPTYTAFCAYGTVEGLLKIEPVLEDPEGYYPEYPEQGLAAIPMIKKMWQVSLT